MGHTQVDANRSGDEVRIRVASTPAVHRAGVHARTATNTVQCLDMVGLGVGGMGEDIWRRALGEIFSDAF